MRLRARRRSLMMWSLTGGPGGRPGAPGRTRPARARRVRRCVRVAVLVTVIGLMRLARGARPRWRPLLAGGTLTAAGFALGGNAWGLIVLPGLWLLLYALLIPGRSGADRIGRAGLERELAGYLTPAQRCDLEATLDRYPDGITSELRDILARQTVAAWHRGIPGAGRL